MIRLRAIRINSQSIVRSTFASTTIIPKCHSMVNIRWASQITATKKHPNKRDKSYNTPVFPTSVNLSEIKRLKLRALETALENHAEKGRWSLIIQLYTYMLGEGFAPQKLSTYHILLTACKHLKKVNNIPKILECIEENNLKMTIVTYQLLLEAFEMSSAPSEVVDQIWDEINSRRLNPTPAMYITTTNFYLSANEFQKAVRYFEDLSKAQPFSTSTLFVSFLKYFASIGNLEMMKSYFERYKSQGFPPDPVPYNCFLEYFSKMQDTTSLLETWDSMKNSFVPPNKDSYCHMMEAYTIKGNMEEANHYFTQMSQKMKPDMQPYIILAKGYARSKNREQVEATLKKATASGEEFNKDTYEFLIDFYAQLSEKKAMLQTSHEMISKGHIPSRSTYATILRITAYQKDYKMMEAYFEDMRRRGISPSEYIYRVILKAWALKGDHINFLRYLRKMNVEDQITPSPKTMEFISMFMKHESPSSIPHQTMQALDTEPESHVLEADIVMEGNQVVVPDEEVRKIVAEIDERAQRTIRK